MQVGGEIRVRREKERDSIEQYSVPLHLCKAYAKKSSNLGEEVK